MNNRRNDFSYDAAGNLTNDLGQTFSYDATGQQTYASYLPVQQSYDGDGLRGKKTDSGISTYYLRSSVLGGQVVAEINSSGSWTRGYVYLGGQMLAIQSSGVNWVHQDPVTKSQRVTNSSGTVVSTIDLDPWGGETSGSSNQAFQPHRFTSYERDANSGDEAMMRRYSGKWHRFDQPDPYDGSYNLTDPQSFNRYAYVQNDPVNFVDPSGLDQWDENPGFIPAWMVGVERPIPPRHLSTTARKERLHGTIFGEIAANIPGSLVASHRFLLGNNPVAADLGQDQRFRRRPRRKSNRSIKIV